MTLAGRSAIITGASLGLGAEISRQFAAAGASLMLCARNVTELDAQAERLKAAYPNTQIVTQRADIASRADVDALFAAAINVFGKLDVLVNNAGVYGPMGSIEATDWDAWVEAIAINLTGTVYCVRKAVEAFKPRRYGKIINLSGGGATNPLPGISAYAASKAAVVRFTETVALEVKEFGIDVNAVAPGALATRLTDQLLAAGPERVGANLHARMMKLKTDKKPVTGIPNEDRTTWIKPRLVCQVKFTEWTHDGEMRHPVFLGLRTDKPARQVRRERA